MINGWKCQIHNDREKKTLKFAEAAQIHKFCESSDARKIYISTFMLKNP